MQSTTLDSTADIWFGLLAVVGSAAVKWFGWILDWKEDCQFMIFGEVTSASTAHEETVLVALVSYIQTQCSP